MLSHLPKETVWEILKFHVPVWALQRLYVVVEADREIIKEIVGSVEYWENYPREHSMADGSLPPIIINGLDNVLRSAERRLAVNAMFASVCVDVWLCLETHRANISTGLITTHTGPWCLQYAAMMGDHSLIRRVYAHEIRLNGRIRRLKSVTIGKKPIVSSNFFTLPFRYISESPVETSMLLMDLFHGSAQSGVTHRAKFSRRIIRSIVSLELDPSDETRLITYYRTLYDPRYIPILRGARPPQSLDSTVSRLHKQLVKKSA